MLLTLRPVFLYNFVEGLLIAIGQDYSDIAAACIVAPNIVSSTTEAVTCRGRLTMVYRRSIRQTFTSLLLIFHHSQARLQNTAMINTMKVRITKI